MKSLKSFNRTTSQLIRSELNHLRDAINRQLTETDPEEENILIPTTQIIPTGTTLFDVEADIPDFVTIRKPVIRH
jgi:hypothetical protein